MLSEVKQRGVAGVADGRLRDGREAAGHSMEGRGEGSGVLRAVADVAGVAVEDVLTEV